MTLEAFARTTSIELQRNVFVDLALGLEQAGRRLDELLAVTGDSPGASPGEPLTDEIVDAVLGLVSLRRTFTIVLEAGLALGSSHGDSDEGALPPRWDRTLLR